MQQRLKNTGVRPPAGGLTDVWIERGAEVLPRAYITYDKKAVGLGLKVTPAGKKGWLLQAVYPGHRHQTRRELGQYPAMTLAQARQKAAAWLALVKSGTDPTEFEGEKRRAAEAERAAKALQDARTFAAVAERFITEHLAGQRRGAVGAREVRNYLVKAWGERPIASITPQDVKALIGSLKAKAPYQARNAFGHAGVMFKWAVHNDLLEGVSPVASLSKKMLFAGAGIAPRQRVLDQDEIAAFWRATARMGFPYGPLYRLLLLTGCRINEIAKAKWSELNPEVRRVIREAAKTQSPVNWAALPAAAKTLTIPAERFKSGVTHVVALSDEALAGAAEVRRRFSFQPGRTQAHQRHVERQGTA